MLSGYRLYLWDDGLVLEVDGGMVVQHGECKEGHKVHFEMIKVANLMVSIFYHN